MAIATIFISSKYNKGEMILDESIVSAGAFIMLIFATVLQLLELGAQREELKLTRAEMKKQSKEFNIANDLTSSTLNQTRFFELLKMKEEYSNTKIERVVFQILYLDTKRAYIEKFVKS